MLSKYGIVAFGLFIRGLILLPFIALSPLAPAQTTNNPTSKVHLLFVWGTKATDTYWSTMISKTKIEESFNNDGKIGLSKDSPYVGTWKILEGENAHPKEILKECKAISTKAGANDAIFVYVLCHGATAVEDDDATGIRVHGLSPVCLNAQELKFREIGIRRSSILKAMQTKPHRLCVLITDSCSVLAGPEPKLPAVRPAPRIVRQGGTKPPSLLAKFLLTEKGVLDINSSDPNAGNMKQGELAMAWTPDPGGLKGKEYIVSAATKPFSGTVFTNAFLPFAEQRMEFDHSFPPDKFYADLKARVKEQYSATKKMVIETSSKGIEVFMSQPSQTLTRFSKDGVALP